MLCAFPTNSLPDFLHLKHLINLATFCIILVEIGRMM